MTDLREKIVGCLRAWTEDTIEDIDAHGEVCSADSAEELADRILALLPKVPQLRWDMCSDVEVLKLGDVALGAVYRTEKLGEFIGYMNGSMTIRAGEEMARAAVEAAVRKALGLE